MSATSSTHAETLMTWAQVHPLDAPPEQKLFHPGLGRMHLTRRAKLALFVVRSYVGIMALMVGLRLIAGL